MTDSRIRWEANDANGSKAAAAGSAIAGNQGAKNQTDGKAAAESMHHDGNFGRYMALKVTKLREQFDAQQLQTTAAKSDIFRGVSIHVNGFTRPSHAELKQLMALHGGRFENYLYRDSVTHIICSNLPDTKIKQLAHERKPIPIVRPEWIVASINAGNLLPISDFQLEPLSAADPHQRRLFAFKRHAAPQLAPSELYPILEQGNQNQHNKPNQTSADNDQDEPNQQQVGPYQEQGQEQEHGRNQQDLGLMPDPNWDSGLRLEQGPEAEGAAERPLKRARTVPPVPVPPQPSYGEERHSPDPLPQPAQRGAEAPGGGPWHAPPHLAASFGGGQAGNGGGAGGGGSDPAPQRRTSPLLHVGVPGTGPGPPGPGPSAPNSPEAAGGGSAGAMARPGGAQGHAGGGGAGGGGDSAAQALAAELRAANDRGPARSTRDDPQFMDRFFRNSRLHFIGTWKTRIEALMAEVEARATAPNPTPYAKGIERVIVHVDMDCFFASVAAVGRPELAGRPLAVSHSNSKKGTAEVSSANYLARSFGIRADMFMAEAMRRCPGLVVVPYEFDKYQEVSERVYRILLSYTSLVQPISCDEAFLDITGLPPDPETLTSRLRAEIAAATQCTASAGIGPNMLVARLATRRAKPNGQFRVTRGSVLEFMAALKVEDLPGVGWSLASKLEGMGVTTVRQVWSSSRTALQKQLGAKAGSDLWAHAHGVDERRVEPPKARKSVGAEVNYGIRFEPDGQAEAERFLGELAGEVAARMRTAAVRGRSVTLKVKRRQAGAPEPAKFMGHGACDNISRSVTLGRFTDNPAELRREAVALLRALAIPPDELRGIGLTVGRLDNDPASHTTKASAPAPAKLLAPPRTTFDASKPPPWALFFQRKVQREQQQQQEEQQQQEQQGVNSPEEPPGAQDPGQQQQQHRSPLPSSSPFPPGAGPRVGPHPHPLPPSSLPAGSPGPTKAPAPPHAPSRLGLRSPSPPPPPHQQYPQYPQQHSAPGRQSPAAPPPPPGVPYDSPRTGDGGGTRPAVVDVPSWYASLYNEWSPVSAWDPQCRGGGPRGQGPGPGAAAGATSPSRVRSPSPSVQTERQAPAVAGMTGGVPGEKASGTERSAPAPSRRRPHLHPVFAALFSQPVDLATPGGSQALPAEGAGGGAERGSGAGAAAGGPGQSAGAAAAREAPPPVAAIALPPGGLLSGARAAAEEGGGPGATSNQEPVPPPSRANEGAAQDRKARAAAISTAVAPASVTGAAPPAKPAVSGTHGTTTAMAAGASARPAAAAAPRPAASTSSAGASAGASRPPLHHHDHHHRRDPHYSRAPAQAPMRASPSRLRRPGSARPVDSIDLSVDDHDPCDNLDELPKPRAAFPAESREPSDNFDDVEVVGEVGGETGTGVGTRGAVPAAAGSARLAWAASAAPAHSAGGSRQAGVGAAATAAAGGPRPAHSGSTGGPTGSTSCPVSTGTAVGAAGARWPGFLRPMTTAAMAAAGAAGGRGAGGSYARGRAAGRGARGRAGASASASAGGGRNGGRGGGGGGGGAAGGPAVAAVQIDRSVLAELPPELRREVEREYGLLPSVPERRPAAAGPAAQTRPAKRGRTAAPPAPAPTPATAGTGATAAAAASEPSDIVAAAGQGAGRGSREGTGAGQPARDPAQAQGAAGPGRAVGGGGADGVGGEGSRRGHDGGGGVDHTNAVVDAEVDDVFFADDQRPAKNPAGVPGAVATTGGDAELHLRERIQQSGRPTGTGIAIAAAGGGSGARQGARAEAAVVGARAAAVGAMPTSMADVDLAVLDELPPELRSEITAVLRNPPAGADPGAAGPSTSAAADPSNAGGYAGRPQRPVPPRLPLTHPHPQPCGRALDARGRAGHAAAAVGAAPAGAASATAAATAASLSVVSELGSGPDVVEVVSVAALPPDAGAHQRLEAAAGHMFRKPGAPLQSATSAGRLQASGVVLGSSEEESLRPGGPVREAFLQAIRRARAACEALEAGKAGEGGTGQLGEQEGEGAGAGMRAVQATCVALAMWLISQDHDLEGVVALLRQVQRISGSGNGCDNVGRGGGDTGAGEECWDLGRVLCMHVRRVVTAVREHVQAKFGFMLKV